MKTCLTLATLAATLLGAQAASAATVFDATGDFAPGYTGAAADLDVTSFTVDYNRITNIFTLSATMAGVIDATTAGVYIIGVNTGTGAIAPFAGLGAGNVRFNQTVRVNKDGSGTVGSTPLAATIAGNAFSVAVSGTLFASTGFAVQDYSWNLWPRTGVGAGTLVTDFSPDNAMLAAAVPEPASWAMMLIGMGAVGITLRRRRTRVAFA
jgi:hypothetical protein